MAIPNKVKLNQIDYSGEHTSTDFYEGPLDALNYDAIQTAGLAMRLAIEAISLCNEVSMTISVALHTASGSAPTNKLAQRELALKVYYVDTVNGRHGTMTVPGPDLSLLTLARDSVDITTGTEVIALVDAIEAFSFTRDGNTPSVTAMRLIGRNN